MVEQQVEIKILFSYLKVIFASEKCKSYPQFNQEIPEFFKE